ncbi:MULTISPECIES: LysE family translocator [Cellvibrio]|uniref:Threonine/homoserine/homoserine lactone efflux protein n=1 Tax=Cellvibrio fibrivorans TaxID=126350 RepID=A0ABU1V389_9GAMM|nr:LysE family translocator [Cellvibrio fibrivorans]MDR7091914.1 threonine/homoserine/homoserine lactone efflux protein [Cellvibrio fibrivorans]
MTTTSMVSLFVALVILAVIPGPGVFTVVARSMASGFFHGLITVFGIVFGDYILIILSVYGLSALASTMGGIFTFIKYAGAAYLVWLGIKLLLTKYSSVEVKPIIELSFFSNFIAGLATTLSNPKAILFYVSFFPAFINVQSVTVIEIGQLLLVATMAVGSVMAAYAYAASKASLLFKSSRAAKTLNVAAGSIMVGSGVLLATKA